MKVKTSLNFVFIMLISTLLVAPLSYWVLRLPHNNRSQIELRTLTDFSNPFTGIKFNPTGIKRLVHGQFLEAKQLLLGVFPDSLLTGKFQNRTVLASSDQFPLRIPLIQSSHIIERGLIASAYSILDDPALPTAILSSGLVLRQQYLFIPMPKKFDESVVRNVENRIMNLASIIEENPAVHFSVLYLERIEWSPANPLNKYFPLASNRQELQLFLSQLPAKLSFDSMLINDLDTYAMNFLHTDPHWNVNGIWTGYQKAYALLEQNYPEISPMLEPAGFSVLEQVKVCGGYARSSMYPCQPDLMAYPQVELPPYTTIIRDKIVDYGQSAKYIAGKLPSSPYGMYSEFWGDDYELVIYKVENDSKRNLLIIGDSYTNPLERYLAAHYHTTYAIDLRHLKDYSLISLIDQYDISDIFILGTPHVLFTPEWTIKR